MELERLAKERENLEQDVERMQKAALHQVTNKKIIFTNH